MRFMPGCSCCGGTPYPTGCSACPTLPDRLFVTLDMACAGYSGDVVQVDRYPPLDGTSVAYIGTLPAPCGDTASYQSVFDCDNPHVDTLYVAFSCSSGSPLVTVQFMCAASAVFGGYSALSPVGQAFFTCPGDLSPVDITVTMNGASASGGFCCSGATDPLGTATVTE